MNTCLFCKINNNEIPSNRVYEDEDFIVFKDIEPKADIHLLVIPRKHISSLDALSIDDQTLMGKMILLLPKIAKKQNLTGFKSIINTGKSGGQEVFHLHIHLLGNQTPL
jgi:histidine triad (HIT) family protein